MSSSVHRAITRQVKEGREIEFIEEVESFIKNSLQYDGVESAFLIKPVRTEDCEYGILRSFESEEALQAFYESDLFSDWSKRVDPLVEGGAVARDVHGLEAFFPLTDHRPPKWKMAVITFIGVWPAAELWSRTLTPLLATHIAWLTGAVVNICIVASLTWIIMPFLTGVFRNWLSR